MVRWRLRWAVVYIWRLRLRWVWEGSRRSSRVGCGWKCQGGWDERDGMLDMTRHSQKGTQMPTTFLWNPKTKQKKDKFFCKKTHQNLHPLNLPNTPIPPLKLLKRLPTPKTFINRIRRTVHLIRPHPCSHHHHSTLLTSPPSFSVGISVKIWFLLGTTG